MSSIDAPSVQVDNVDPLLAFDPTHTRAWRFSAAVAACLLLFVSAGCRSGDPVDAMIRRVDAAPPEQRPPDWNETRRLMTRAAPAAGDPAPDFTLKTSDGAVSITRSSFHPGKPQVLIFGSFT